MSRAELTLRDILGWTRAFCLRHPPAARRGRPPRYGEDLILALWLFKQLNGVSWRKLEAAARQILPEVPDFSTLYYRVVHVPLERLEGLNLFLAQEVLRGKSLEAVIVDGTG